MDNTDFPAVIETYFLTHDRHDTDAAVATFGPDATVVDENVAYTGTERIRWFLENSASEFTYTRTLTGVEHLGDGAYLATNHLSGNFPGGEVDLRYRFELRDGLIHHLEIAP